MLCWFINTSFLEKYYMLNKQDSLIDGYDVINGASETGELNSSEFDVTFDNLCANGNIAVMIISSNRAIVRKPDRDLTEIRQLRHTETDRYKVII